MGRVFGLLAGAILLLIGSISPTISTADTVRPAYSNAVILVIRHAEKDPDSEDLTPQGVQHAVQYATYFKNYKFDGRPIHLDAIYAAADSKDSSRCRLTVEPTGKALGIPVNTTFKNKDFADLAASLQSKAANKHVLICWHHGRIPDLLSALGADPNLFLPGGQWPDAQYSWVIQLCYDKDGHLIPSKTMKVVEQ